MRQQHPAIQHGATTTTLALFLWLLIAADVAVVAQNSACTGQQTCLDCLNAASDCTWSAGACLGNNRCVNRDFCYSAQNFPELMADVEEICQVADTAAAEQTLCQQQGSSCAACVSTSISTGTCQWFDTPIGVSQGICASQCNPVGQCGVTSCGGGGDGDAVVPPPSCSQATTCTDCLSLNCGWAIGECFDSCDDLFDVACYSQANFPGQETVDGICQVETDLIADRETCATAGTSCSDCVATTLADGVTTCQWLEDTQFCASACGQAGCGVTTCPVNVETPSCDTANTCLDCLALQGTNCGWAAIGECLPSCDFVADVACYQVTIGGPTAQELCQIDATSRQDAATCGEITTCADCLATTLQDGITTCQWNVDNNFCASQCNQLGCGVTDQCPDNVGISDGNTCDGATCLECLSSAEDGTSSAANSCAWSSTGSCLDSCTAAPTDTACYSSGTFPGRSASEICKVETDNQADRVACASQTSCSECVATTLQDGMTSCQWFADTETCASACDQTGCGVTTTCPAAVDCTQAATCSDCLALADNGSTCAWTADQCLDGCNVADAPCYTTECPAVVDCTQATTCSDCLALADNGSTCAWTIGQCMDGCNVADAPCYTTECPAAPVDCMQATTCNDCLSGDGNCAWTINQCMDGCNVADAACYTQKSFPDQTPTEICQIDQTNQANAALCSSQTSCGDCVGTTLADGATTCQWFPDGDYCASGCGMMGCGVTQCPVVDAPVPVPDAPAPACDSATTCNDCLSGNGDCAWTIGKCMDGCNVADAACYTQSSFPDQTPAEICQIDETNRADAALCNSQGNCGDCVETTLQDGTTKCQWFEDGSFCASGCGMTGCGATECTSDSSSVLSAVLSLVMVIPIVVLVSWFD